MAKKHLTNGIIFSAAFLLIAAAVGVGYPIGNNLYFQNLGAIGTQLWPSTVVDEGDSHTVENQMGKDLAEQVEEEGAVLVKNNGTLPMEKGDKVNILGYGAYQWIYSGSGSGRVLSQKGDSSWDSMDDIVDAFNSYGVQVNTEPINYYRTYQSAMHDLNTLNNNVDSNPYGMYGLRDPDCETNSAYKTILDNAVNYSDTAIVVLSRQGGESDDLPEWTQYVSKPSNHEDHDRHQLMISEAEENLLNYAAENFDNVVVVINSTNAFQLDFLATIKGIDACLVVGATGEFGANVIPSLLYEGGVSPSGRLADTYAFDFRDTVYFHHTGFNGVRIYNETGIPYGVNQTTNGAISRRESLPYIDYSEGIYVGYRWFETADAEGTFTGESRQLLDDLDRPYTVNGYDAVVQYPFGYGLSYTSFTQRIVEVSVPNNSTLTKDTEIKVTVQVTNTGTVAGKEAVQLYMTPEYKKGGVEKSYVNLVDFDKTSTIEPGKSEFVELNVRARDFASFDCYDSNSNGHATYEIDAGTYQLKLMKNSHEAIEGESLTYTTSKDIILNKDPISGEEIETLFTGENAIDGVPVDGIGEEDVPDYISRKDFKNLTEPLENQASHRAADGRHMGTNTKNLILFAGSNSSDQTKANAWNNAIEDELGEEIDVDALHSASWGQSGSVKVTERVDGKVALTEDGEYLADPENWDDPLWDEMLDQVSYNNATGLVNRAHPNIPAIDSIGFPGIYSLDGPNQISSFANASNRGVGYPSATVLAQTFNKTLAYEWGLSFGTDMNNKGVYGVYGPAMNLHRSPFSGRNYEYYSEDPRLSGYMATNAVKGIRDTGRIAVIKHFVAAETETGRDSLYTWMTEQALRELYLEPFRMCVQSGYTTAMMTAYNRVGAVWAGGSAALMRGVLRKEWGYKGYVITDYSDNNQYMNLDQTIRLGGDIGMAVGLRFNYQSNRRAAHVLKDAIKHTVFAYVDSLKANADFNANGGYNGKTIDSKDVIPGKDWLTPIVITVEVLVPVAATPLLVFAILNFIKYFKKVA
ncbi:MAG: glycoside hydrolase family 3 C-terminal domain-containing protein [Bacilli bacterium]|nr:glycoside hydrolase family 3 C-terminal domain-containing protein [Bacilli bacterium]